MLRLRGDTGTLVSTALNLDTGQPVRDAWTFLNGPNGRLDHRECRDEDGFLDFYLGTGAPSYAALLPNFMFRNREGRRFVDVTEAFGAYASPDATVESPDFGTIPARAEDICALTYYCALGDIHPTSAGHTVIARLVEEALRS